MYLKALEIQGFKSFPDKIKLEFGQGITSIVGPNGSGKSNISDAVRWVLGEQSVKMLRGSRMEDVIFSGTEARKQLGFAEVSLILCNEDKSLPIDFSEVTITRRVYRSGESEYYINKSSCRLKDIHELFMDTGLGKDGYSIIGQGRVGEILSTKSEDRRNIFEEAAGITKYKYRKQEAEKKLELTRQNLIRIKDIIHELEMQIEPLHEQAEKAKEFLNFREELKTLEINVSLQMIEKLRKDLSGIEQNDSILRNQLEGEQIALEKLENRIEELYTSIKEKDKLLEEIRQNLYTNEKLLQNITNEKELMKNNIINNQQYIEKFAFEIESVNTKTDELNSKLEENSLLLNDSIEIQLDLQNSIQLLEADQKKSYASVESCMQVIESLKSDLIEKMNSLSQVRAKNNSIGVLENNFSERKITVENEIRQKNTEIDQLKNIITKLEGSLSESNSLLLKKKQQLLQYQDEQKDEKEHLELIRNSYEKQLLLIKEKAAKKAILHDMEKEYEGYNKSVRSILTEWQKGRLSSLNIHGPVSQLINVPEKYITAIETVLGAAMQNIIVQTEEDAKAAIQFLKARHLGRATFLPISTVKGMTMHDAHKITGLHGCLGIASQLVQYSDKYQEIVNYLLGRVVVVDHIDNAIKMARATGYRFRIVTLEGDVLNPGGSFTGGSVSKTSGFLSRTNQIQVLSREITQLQATAKELNTQIEANEKNLTSILERVRETELELKEYEAKQIRLNTEIEHNDFKYKHLEQSCTELLNENSQLDEQIMTIRDEIAKLSYETKLQEEEIKHIEQLIAEKQEYYKDKMQKNEQLSQMVMSKKTEISTVEKDIGVLNERIKTLKMEVTNCYEQKRRKENECLQLKQANKEIEQTITQKENKSNLVEEEIKKCNDKIIMIIKEKDDTEKLISNNQAEVKEMREKISILQNQCHKIESQKVRIEMEFETIINRLWDEYELTYSTAAAYKKDIGNMVNVKKRINELKDKIKELGNVNVNAIETYRNVKERFEFLSNQKNDLEEAEESLVKIIGEMTKLMNKQFAEQFKIINENFNQIFNELFEGGRAELRLSDPENMLESGIEIEVQPPGKKLQNIMLLSGGEKAFTAIALLFAILKVRPAPFCILDEIESALDENNVYRFADYLKKVSRQTQFVVVTHRRGTMESSDTLYGVTMQEKGVSKLLELNINEMAV